MPVDMKRYPTYWRDVRAAIMQRARERCEFCGVPNYAVGHREPNGKFIGTGGNLYHDAAGNGELSYKEARELADWMNEDDNMWPEDARAIVIVLTVAHLGAAKPDGSPGDPHDKMDCRPENLKALCQACHLRLDINEHMANAAATRHAKRLKMQPELFAQPARQGE